MELDSQPSPSTFAQIVDRLRTKNEAELKALYIQFFKKDLNEEWATITQPSDFKNATEEDINSHSKDALQQYSLKYATPSGFCFYHEQLFYNSVTPLGLEQKTGRLSPMAHLLARCKAPKGRYVSRTAMRVFFSPASPIGAVCGYF